MGPAVHRWGSFFGTHRDQRGRGERPPLERDGHFRDEIRKGKTETSLRLLTEVDPPGLPPGTDPRSAA
jgi:hypothetical protein